MQLQRAADGMQRPLGNRHLTGTLGTLGTPSTHGEPGKWSPRSCALISNGSSDAGVYVTCTADLTQLRRIAARSVISASPAQWTMGKFLRLD